MRTRSRSTLLRDLILTTCWQLPGGNGVSWQYPLPSSWVSVCIFIRLGFMMNQMPVFSPSHENAVPEHAAPGFDFDNLLAIARRQWRVVAISIAIFMGLGVYIHSIGLYDEPDACLLSKS